MQYFHSSEFAQDLLELTRRAASVFAPVERCLSISSPVYVFGDIHGNLTDLKFFAQNMWKLGMHLTAGKFLFLGDYVDRGLSSVECIAYLFALKVMHPEKMFMLRGNHELRGVNGWKDHYGIQCLLAQCERRFGSEGRALWEEVQLSLQCSLLCRSTALSIACRLRA